MNEFEVTVTVTAALGTEALSYRLGVTEEEVRAMAEDGRLQDALRDVRTFEEIVRPSLHPENLAVRPTVRLR